MVHSLWGGFSQSNPYPYIALHDIIAMLFYKGPIMIKLS